MSRKILQPGLSPMVLFFMLLLAGCSAEDRPDSASANRDRGLVGIVAAAPAEGEEQQALEDARQSEIASGATFGAAVGGGLVYEGVWESGLLGLLLLPVIPVAAIIGGVVGGIIDADRAAEIEAARTELVRAQQEFFIGRTPEEILSDALISESREFAGYRLIRVTDSEADVDTVAIADAEWRFRPVDLVDSRLFLELEASVRLPSADTGEPDTHQLLVKRGPHSFEDWGEDSARRFREALRDMQQQVASALFAEIFAVYRAPSVAALPLPTSPDPDFERMAVPFAGFRPLQPEYRITAESMANGPHGASRAKLYWVETPTLDTLKPLLVWEPLPGTIQADPFVATRPFVDADGKEIGKVTYDLMIFCPWLKPVYMRSDIPEPRHQVEEPLPTGEKCNWSVRAKFEMDGRTRITDWGQPLVPIGEGWPVEESRRGGPMALLHRFNFYTPDK